MVHVLFQGSHRKRNPRIAKSRKNGDFRLYAACETEVNLWEGDQFWAHFPANSRSPSAYPLSEVDCPLCLNRIAKEKQDGVR